MTLKSEKEEHENTDFQKLQYVKQSYAQNPAAMKIAKRKELEILGWTPDEVDEVMSSEGQAPVLQEGSPQVDGGGQPAIPSPEVQLGEEATSPQAA